MSGYAFDYTYLKAQLSAYPDPNFFKLKDGILSSTNTADYIVWGIPSPNPSDILKLDLGSAKSVGAVIVYYVESKDNYNKVFSPLNVEVYGSTDDVTYTKIGGAVPSSSDTIVGTAPWDTHQAGTGTLRLQIDFAPTSVRYLKLRVTANSTDSSGFSFSEINIYRQSLSLGGSATLNTGEPANYVLINDFVTGDKLAKVFPDGAGAWSYASYVTNPVMVTVIGPNGYQPISHGPFADVTGS